MKKLRFFGLLAAVVLLAFAFVIACDNGSTTPPPPPGGEDGDPDQYPILGGDGSAGAVTNLINFSLTTRVENDGSEDPEEYDPTTAAVVVIFQTRAQADGITGANLHLEPLVTGATGSWLQGTGSDINKWIYTLGAGSVTTSGPVEVKIVNKDTYVGIAKTVNVLAAPLTKGHIDYTLTASPATGTSTKIILTFAAADKDKVATANLQPSEIAFNAGDTDAVAVGSSTGTWVPTNADKMEWTLELLSAAKTDGKANVTINNATTVVVDSETDEVTTWKVSDKVKQVALKAPAPVGYTYQLIGTAPAINKVSVTFTGADDIARLDALGFNGLTGINFDPGTTGVTGVGGGSGWAKTTDTATSRVFTYTFDQTTGAPQTGEVKLSIALTGIDNEPKTFNLPAPAAINYSVSPIANAGTGVSEGVKATFVVAPAANLTRLTELGLVTALTDSEKVIFNPKNTGAVEATAGWVSTTFNSAGELTLAFDDGPTVSGTATLTIKVPGISPTPKDVSLVAPKIAWNVSSVGGTEGSVATTTLTLKFAAEVQEGDINKDQFTIEGVKGGAATVNVTNLVPTGSNNEWTLTFAQTAPGTAKISTTSPILNAVPESITGATTVLGTATLPFRIKSGAAITYTVVGNSTATGTQTTIFTIEFSASLAGLTPAFALTDITITGDTDSGAGNTTPIVAALGAFTEVGTDNISWTVTGAVTVADGTATAKIASYPPVSSADVTEIAVYSN